MRFRRRPLPPFACSLLRSQLFLWTAVAFTSGSLFGVEPDWKHYVAANSSTNGLIHDFELDLDVLIEATADQDSKDIQQWIWARQGSRERIRTRAKAAIKLPKQPQPVDQVRDIYLTDEQSRVLEGWDPNSGFVLSPQNQGQTRAAITPRTQEFASIDPGYFILLSFHFAVSPHQRHSLEQLLGASPSVSIVDDGNVSKDKLVHIRAQQPDSEVVRKGSYVDVFLDPRRGYQVSRVIEHEVTEHPGPTPGKNVVSTLERRRRAEAFFELGNGLFLPKEVVQEVFSSASDTVPTETARITVKLVKLNEPLRPGALDFQFPENALVADDSTPGERVVHLWGKNNQPSRQIHSMSELGIETRSAAPLGIRFVLAAVSIIAVVALIALRLWRQRATG